MPKKAKKVSQLSYILFGVFILILVTAMTCGKETKTEVHIMPEEVLSFPNPEEVKAEVKAKVDEVKESVEEVKESVEEAKDMIKDMLPSIEIPSIEEIPIEETPVDSTKTSNLKNNTEGVE